jgi:hypothetical protein
LWVRIPPPPVLCICCNSLSTRSLGGAARAFPGPQGVVLVHSDSKRTLSPVFLAGSDSGSFRLFAYTFMVRFGVECRTSVCHSLTFASASATSIVYDFHCAAKSILWSLVAFGVPPTNRATVRSSPIACPASMAAAESPPASPSAWPVHKRCANTPSQPATVLGQTEASSGFPQVHLLIMPCETGKIVTRCDTRIRATS